MCISVVSSISVTSFPISLFLLSSKNNNTHKSCRSSYYSKGIDERPNFFLYPKKTFNRAIEHLLFLLELFGLLRVWFYRVIMFPGEPAIGRKEFACDASGKCFCKLPFVLDSNRDMEQSWKHSLK